MTVKLTTPSGTVRYFDSEEDCLEFYNAYIPTFEIRKSVDGNALWRKSDNRLIGFFSSAPPVGFF